MEDIGNKPVNEDGWGLVIRSWTEGAPFFASYSGQPIDLKDSLVKGDAKFQTATLTAKIGVPLKAAPYPSKQGQYYNVTARMTFCDPDPSSSTFLWPVCDVHDEIGDMIFVRTDGHAVNQMQFEGLFAFLNEYFIKFASPLSITEEGEAKEELKRRIVTKLTPEAFHTFFEAYRRHQVRSGSTAYKSVTSPVLSKVDPAYGRCFLKGKPDKPLAICAKCKTSFYCDRMCQKEDWKQHKQVCGME